MNFNQVSVATMDKLKKAPPMRLLVIFYFNHILKSANIFFMNYMKLNTHKCAADRVGVEVELKKWITREKEAPVPTTNETASTSISRCVIQN